MLLQMKNITKMYGELCANRKVDLSLNKGEVLAVVGENGAGKSTLMKVLYGLEAPTEGDIFLEDKPLAVKTPTDAIQAGIGMVQQHFMLFSEFTVAENIVYGQEPRKKGLFFNRAQANTIVKELSEKYLLQVDPKAKIKDCSVGLQQRVEILKVLYQNANIVILDEPSAVLTPQEVRELFKTIRQLVAMGKSIIIITHKLHEVMEISDRVLVMRAGEVVKETKTADTSIEELSFLMVGRRIINQPVASQTPGEAVLQVKNLEYQTPQGNLALKGIDLHVNAGEIVGIAGVSGNGQTELIECINGLSAASCGSITLNDTEITTLPINRIRESGFACIPEDRYKHGCAKDGTLTETALMAHQYEKQNSRRGVLKSKNIQTFTTHLLNKYSVKYSSSSQKAGELSGGNLQKLIAAREIEQQTPFLVAAEPTRGVDIGAMEFIHDKLLERRKEGCAILLVSSELSEILKLSDRVYTIYEGKLNREFKREEATEEALGLMMMGGKQHA